MKSRLIVIFISAFLLIPTYIIHAEDYYYYDLGTSSGFTSIYANAINDSGNIAGYALTDYNSARAFLWKPSSGMQNLGIGTQPYGYSKAYDINNNGNILGVINGYGALWNSIGTVEEFITGGASINNNDTTTGCTSVGSNSRAYIYSSAYGMTIIDTLGGYNNCGVSINNYNSVVGSSEITAGSATYHAFIYTSAGSVQDLNNLASNLPNNVTLSTAKSINNNNQVVGEISTVTTSASHAYLYTPGEGVTLIGTLSSNIPGGSSGSWAQSINDNGQAIGYSVASDGKPHAFTYTKSSGIQDLNNSVLNLPKGTTLANATDINNKGQVVGMTSDNHAFLLTPKEQPKVPLVTLANLCDKVYRGSDDEGNYKFLDSISPTISTESYKGFRAAAYRNSENGQIVIAFRGTETAVKEEPFRTIKNICSDSSFVTGNASSNLKFSVYDAVDFVKQVIDTTGSANITLTGHSLGGAIAQLVGLVTGLDTYAFNAPGAGGLYSQIFGNIEGKNGTNVNYRICGDQISLAGTPIGPTVTLETPSNITFVQNTEITGLSKNWDSIWAAHGIQNFFNDIPITNVSGLNYATTILNTVKANADYYYISPLGYQIRNLEFVISVLDKNLGLFDPAQGTDFLFTADSGSPHFNSIVLPALGDINFYKIRSESDDIWSDFQTLLPGEEYLLGTGIDGINFQAFDKDGNPIVLPDAFLFGLSFDSTGMFSGTLTVTSPAPIPSSILLFGFPLLLLGVSQLRSRYRRK